MSADNWTTCPRCADHRKQALVARVAEVSASYGKVPVEDFDRMRQELDAQKREPLKETFREDYEIYGAEDGEVEVRYAGRCSECSLALEFAHSHPLDLS